MRNKLLIFGSFAYDSQRILAAIGRFAFVGIKLFLNIGTVELRVAPFTYANYWRALLHDPQFALRHNCSLAHLAGRA
jgi:hypothetical protein